MLPRYLDIFHENINFPFTLDGVLRKYPQLPVHGYFKSIFPKRSRSAKGEIAFDDDARVVYIEIEGDSSDWLFEAGHKGHC